MLMLVLILVLMITLFLMLLFLLETLLVVYLQIIPPDCIILDNCTLENFILADEPFAKALRIFETCVLFSNNLCGKLVSSLELPIKFDEWFEVTSVPFFIADFSLLSYELDNFTFNVLY